MDGGTRPVRNRKLFDILVTGGVGGLTLLGGFELVENAVELGDLITPHIEKYFGIISSKVVESGLPAVVGLGTLSFMYTAIKATDKYLSEERD